MFYSKLEFQEKKKSKTTSYTQSYLNTKKVNTVLKCHDADVCHTRYRRKKEKWIKINLHAKKSFMWLYLNCRDQKIISCRPYTGNRFVIRSEISPSPIVPKVYCIRTEKSRNSEPMCVINVREYIVTETTLVFLVNMLKK
jgi:hypothetical protein